MNTTAPLDVEAWVRLRVFLSSLCPGDIITARDAVRETHLEQQSVDVVLGALTRARLFEQHGEHFVRCQLDFGRG
jgi:hypothetical protein